MITSVDDAVQPGVLTPPGRVGRVIALVPVHDETATVEATIVAVQSQSRVPDELYVLVDNHDQAVADELAMIALSCGASVLFAPEGNPWRKAGNLNAAMTRLLLTADANDVICGFDSDSVPDRDFIRNAVAHLEAGYGAVGATFHGHSGGRLLGALQRAEFARFAQHQNRRVRVDVLSGTGWAIRAGVLADVAESRPDGQVYDVTSIVEDYELTLTLLHAGVRIITPADCLVTTDVMTTWRDWVSQRLRWQHGTLDELRKFRFTKHTRPTIARQVVMYAGMAATPLTVIYLGWSAALYGWSGLDPLHAPLFAGCVAFLVAEEAWQARRGGVGAVLATLALVPDWLYALRRQAVYVRALWRLIRRKGSAWGAGTVL